MRKTTIFLVMVCFLPFLLIGQQKNDYAILSKVKTQLGNEFSKTDVDALQLKVTDSHLSKQSKLEHYYFRQNFNGLEIYGTESSIHLKPDGSTFKFNNRLVQGASSYAKRSITPSIDPIQAIQAVAKHLQYSNAGDLEVTEHSSRINRAQKVSKGDISRRDIPVKLVYQSTKFGDLILAWDLSVYETQKEEWWSLRIDAHTGEIIAKDSWMVKCNFDHENEEHTCSNHSSEHQHATSNLSEIKEEKAGSVGGYRVYALPLAHPGEGGRTLVTDPDNAIASPYGWHDTNGAPGAEFTTTQGNNVHAYDDGNNVGYSVDGGSGLLFDFPLDLSQDPENFEDAGLTNLFYWNNIAHDVLYQYGFDEVSGNFQENNYGNGGSASDHVNARSQISLWCNATFGTPGDGANPTMSMYICNGRDGDYSNAVILHEYGHGLSNRLTGGPSASGCLGNAEQMGEGWSDYVGLMLTMKPGDAAGDARPIGDWLFNNPGGIRPYPYSTNMSVNPHTYASSFSGTSQPHGIGSVWCNMLWEMTWDLIAQYGYDADIYNGTGGNNIAFQLVVEGMKLQPCSPGFVDGRDAILAADQALYGGANQCLIWAAFARRGLGANADQGSSSNRSDGVEAFNVPSSCGGSGCLLKFGNGNSVNLAYTASSNNTFTVESDGNWTATTSASWITLNTTSGSGNGTVSFNVSENPVFSPRVGIIEITCSGFALQYTVSQDAQPCVQSYGSIPYATDFESGSLDNNWCTISSDALGRIEVTSLHTPRGTNHLVMDRSSDGDFTLNEATLGLQLAGATNVGLVFWWKELSDETHPQDGVFLSDDGGATYVKVFDFTSGNPTYAEVSLNLTQLAADNNLTLSNIFIIKFQQYDNFPAATDGIAIDDITVQTISCNVGASCDDNDPCTINDVYTATCACEGTFEDTDADGVCDANDQCPGSDDNLDFDGDGTPDGCDLNVFCGNCTGSINTFPHTEDFEAGIGSLCQYTGEDFDWAVNSNATSSSSTGPTAAYQGVNYFYVESSSPNFPSKVTAFESGCYDLSGASTATLNFWYHMYGATMGTLDLEVTTNQGANWVSVWSLTGDQTDNWFNANIDISSYTGGTLSYRFTATTTTSFTSDFALDEITVNVGTLNCTPGTACDDNDDCTTNDVYDSSCNCSGTFQDSDNDTVCDANDVCPGFDDRDDADGDGIPDGCDTDCSQYSTSFPDNPLTHTGSGANSTTINFPSGTESAVFTISGLGARLNGNQSNRFIEEVTVSYVDGNGNTVVHGTYSGNNVSSINISLTVDLQSLTVSLTDGYDGNTNANMSVSFSSITYCSQPCLDDDNDGVCNDLDQCPGYDDNDDMDGDGIPDGCDGCNNTNTPFPNNTLSHNGTGSTSSSITLASNENIAFSITGLGSKTGGKPSTRYIDEVTVQYTDGNGNVTVLGPYSGQNQNSVNVTIPGVVQNITVTLRDAFDGDAPNISVNLSTINSCMIPPSALKFNTSVDVKAYPNPFNDYLNIELSLSDYSTTQGLITVLDAIGRTIHQEEVSWENRLQLSFDSSNWTGGVYYIYYSDGKYKAVQKVLNLK